ncbi:hypothetical protein [Amycolatopsis sp. cmx-11-12]|uniref:hypothetical protein n=1 Tax=Amycolatopsis sp. cmx-11-12 TaxID=2785795 RepID=UPI00391761CD
MKLLIPVSTMLKFAFFLVVIAAVAGSAISRDHSGSPESPSLVSTVDHSKVVREEMGKEVFFPCRPTQLSS